MITRENPRLFSQVMININTNFKCHTLGSRFEDEIFHVTEEVLIMVVYEGLMHIEYFKSIVHYFYATHFLLSVFLIFSAWFETCCFSRTHVHHQSHFQPLTFPDQCFGRQKAGRGSRWGGGHWQQKGEGGHTPNHPQQWGRGAGILNHRSQGFILTELITGIVNKVGKSNCMMILCFPEGTSTVNIHS